MKTGKTSQSTERKEREDRNVDTNNNNTSPLLRTGALYLGQKYIPSVSLIMLIVKMS